MATFYPKMKRALASIYLSTTSAHPSSMAARSSPSSWSLSPLSEIPRVTWLFLVGRAVGSCETGDSRGSVKSRRRKPRRLLAPRWEI
ncbi:hypothetical protein BDW60DRAFT_196353 [Aspergillus nidulans var. acristatus]